MFCFIALTKSVTQNIGGVTERHCLQQGILSSKNQTLSYYRAYISLTK